MKNICSDSFNYNEDVIIKCDGNYHSDIDSGGVGWVIIDKKTREVIIEGGKYTNSDSSSESEHIAIVYALKDISNIDYIDSIIIETDYEEIIKSISKNSYNLKDELDKFNSWCIEKTDRSNLSRAHNIADYMIQKNKNSNS